MAEAAKAAPGSGPHSASAEAAHKGGLPQLKYEYWPGQIVWLLIIFVVLYTLLSKVFLPRVRGVFDAREAKISGDMASARALRDQAQAEAAAVQAELNAARAQSQKTAADSKAKSAAEAAERQGALEAELNVTLGKAEARIRASRDAAMSQVSGIAGDLAQAIALKLTGKAADKAELAAAVNAVRT